MFVIPAKAGIHGLSPTTPARAPDASIASVMAPNSSPATVVEAAMSRMFTQPTRGWRILTHSGSGPGELGVRPCCSPVRCSPPDASPVEAQMGRVISGLSRPMADSGLGLTNSQRQRLSDQADPLNRPEAPNGYAATDLSADPDRQLMFAVHGDGSRLPVGYRSRCTDRRRRLRRRDRGDGAPYGTPDRARDRPPGRVGAGSGSRWRAPDARECNQRLRPRRRPRGLGRRHRDGLPHPGRPMAWGGDGCSTRGSPRRGERGKAASHSRWLRGRVSHGQ